LSKLRIGSITYTNTWPITHFFGKDNFDKEIEIIPQVPSQLNRQMAEGLIDIGPISSFSYAENADKYFLLPNLSVSAYGKVGSILLFTKTDLQETANKKVALSNTSATSVNLLKIILEGFFAGKPEYLMMSPKIDTMLDCADSALLIGDEAILAARQYAENKQIRIFDLGEEWLKRTNHWMTFAVWAVRREVFFEARDLLYLVYQKFLASKERSMKNNHREIINKAYTKFGGTLQFWEDYFRGLSHELNTEQIQGLKAYYQLAKDIKVLKHPPVIEIIDFDNTLLQCTVR